MSNEKTKKQKCKRTIDSLADAVGNDFTHAVEQTGNVHADSIVDFQVDVLDAFALAGRREGAEPDDHANVVAFEMPRKCCVCGAQEKVRNDFHGMVVGVTAWQTPIPDRIHESVLVVADIVHFRARMVEAQVRVLSAEAAQTAGKVQGKRVAGAEVCDAERHCRPESRLRRSGHSDAVRGVAPFMLARILAREQAFGRTLLRFGASRASDFLPGTVASNQTADVWVEFVRNLASKRFAEPVCKAAVCTVLINNDGNAVEASLPVRVGDGERCRINSLVELKQVLGVDDELAGIVEICRIATGKGSPRALDV